jgi:hypothetical protein
MSADGNFGKLGGIEGKSKKEILIIQAGLDKNNSAFVKSSQDWR